MSGTSAETGSAVDDELDTEFEIRWHCVTEEQHASRLDRVLAQVAPEFSRSHLQGLIERGHVQVDVAVAESASRKVKAGQQLRLHLVPPDESLAFRPEALALDVVFEDTQVLVIHKPAGLVVHPAAGNWTGTLLNGLLHRDPAAAQLPRAGIVHRLDKDTSGLMVVGRTLEAVTALVRDLAVREVKRQYLALVHGDVGEAPFSVAAPIGRDPANRIRMAVTAQGKPARTDVQRLGWREGISAVRCTLHSGRTHQIRVHLSHEGHPLVADSTYGGASALGMTRQALHATELGFSHPVSREWLTFQAPPPADFAQAWSRVMAC